MLAVVNRDVRFMSHAGPTCLYDKDIMLAAVQQDWNTLQGTRVKS